jgi:DNA-binding IclR family transcriptional regulator
VATVPAANHALGILTFLAHQASPVPAAVIARALGLPRSTTYHLLTTLCDAGFVTHYHEERVYGLGLTAYELGSGYTRQEPLQRLARKPLADLSDACRNSAHLSVLRGTDVIYVIEERASGRPRLITDVGVRLPAHRTASGRAMLAALTTQQVSVLYPGSASLGDQSETGPRSVSMLRRMLVDVRRQSFAAESSEVTAGLSSVAMAVVDKSGYPIAAVTVTYPEQDADEELQRRTLSRIRATVQVIQRRLGGR